MITKTEATTSLTQREQNEYLLMETMIDEALRTHDGRTFVNCDNVSNRVRECLMRDYRKAGWTVDFHSDQRDGSSLEFK